MRRFVAVLIAGLVGSVISAEAAVTISTDTTENMSCSGGVCSPTAIDAVLNVGDLETLLAAGNVEVTTTGSGVQADTIAVKWPFSWSVSSTLSFVAKKSIAINRHIAVAGTGGLSLSNDGALESLTFGPVGHVTFANLSSSLTINGGAYKLINTVKRLAKAIAAHPGHNFALAASYSAEHDGFYGAPPVPTSFSGTFEGLGNTISRLSLRPENNEYGLAMFFDVTVPGTLRDIGLVNEVVGGNRKLQAPSEVSGLIAENAGTVFRAFNSGRVIGCDCRAQGYVSSGLVAVNYGTVEQSYSSASTSHSSETGGLIGENLGTVRQSYATGSVRGNSVGGLIGYNGGAVSQSYATGSITGKPVTAYIGGLIGDDEGGNASQSYSTGAVSPKGKLREEGGFLGFNNAGSFSHCYWDTTSSGKNRGVGSGSDRGITGLTTEALQSGLPAGFDPSVWAENPSINDGLPYLIAIPPQ